MKQLVEKYRELKKELMDLEKAFDKVWRVLHECGVDGYLIRNLSSLCNGSRACVRLVSGVGEHFEVRRGSRQGCVMSSWLFKKNFL